MPWRACANICGRRRSGQAAADRDVSDRRHRAGPEPLEEPPGHEHLHRWREATDDQADGEKPDADREGPPSPRRSMIPPTTTMPMSEPSMNAVKTQP